LAFLLEDRRVLKMEHNSDRRGFFKYLLSSFAFAVTSIFSFKINKNEGFKVGKRIIPFGSSTAAGECGAGLNCAGGGGECGAGLNCAGGQGDPYPSPGGGGQCGAGLNCAGS